MTTLTGAELVLALPLREHETTGACEIDEHFGTSAIWNPREAALVLLSDFHFTFTLALREGKVDVDVIESNLLFIYMRQLRLGKNTREFESSADGDQARRLDRMSVTLGKDMTRSEILQKSEVLLGKAFLQDSRALFAEKTHNYKRADEGEDFEQLHQLFHVAPWEPGSFESNDAFKSVYTIACRNHVITATLIAAMLPFAPIVSNPTNPPATDSGSGKSFLLSGNRRTMGYIVVVKTKDKTPSVIFRGSSAEITAVSMVAKQLGVKMPLCQKLIVPNPDPTPDPTPDPNPDPTPDPTPDPNPGRRLHYQRGSAVLLTPAATPFWHPIFSSTISLSLSQSNFLVAMRARTPSSLLPFNCDILRPCDFLFLGELQVDCTLEERFGVSTTSRVATKPSRHAGGMGKGKKRVLKRLRSLEDDSDGLPRAKRVLLLRDTLEYKSFLRDLVLPMETWQLVLMLVGEKEFMEVLSASPKFENIPPALVYRCRDIIIKLEFFRDTSTIVQRFDNYLVAHQVNTGREWHLWWESETCDPMPM